MDVLREYLKASGTQQVALANRLGVTPGLVSQWLAGIRPIAATQAIAIERETGGAVKVEELRPDIDWSVIRGQPPREAA